MCFNTDCDDDEVDENRRSFLVGGMAALAGFTTLATHAVAPPPTRVLDEPTTRHGKVTFKSGDKEIDGYLARPKAEGKVPAVLVIAGNRITEEYIPNTCAALAVAGYVGLAPNIFHPVPDSARTPDEITKSLEGWTDADFLRDIRSGAAYLEGHEAVRAGSMGILGFCSGGRRALLYADRFQDVRAVVPYHPGKTEAKEVARVEGTGADPLRHRRQARPSVATSESWRRPWRPRARRWRSTSTRAPITASWPTRARTTGRTRRSSRGSGPWSS